MRAFCDGSPLLIFLFQKYSWRPETKLSHIYTEQILSRCGIQLSKFLVFRIDLVIFRVDSLSAVRTSYKHIPVWKSRFIESLLKRTSSRSFCHLFSDFFYPSLYFLMKNIHRHVWFLTWNLARLACHCRKSRTLVVTLARLTLFSIFKRIQIFNIVEFREEGPLDTGVCLSGPSLSCRRYKRNDSDRTERQPPQPRNWQAADKRETKKKWKENQTRQTRVNQNQKRKRARIAKLLHISIRDRVCMGNTLDCVRRIRARLRPETTATETTTTTTTTTSTTTTTRSRRDQAQV